MKKLEHGLVLRQIKPGLRRVAQKRLDEFELQAAGDEKNAIAAIFETRPEKSELDLRAKQVDEERQNRYIQSITEALLQVGAGNLDVQTQRDFQADAIDILAYLVDTTISELRVLEAENKKRNADEMENIIRKLLEFRVRKVIGP